MHFVIRRSEHLVAFRVDASVHVGVARVRETKFTNAGDANLESGLYGRTVCGDEAETSGALN